MKNKIIVTAFLLLFAFQTAISTYEPVYAYNYDERQQIFNEFLQTIPITVNVNGNDIDLNGLEPKVLDDRILVPMRRLFEVLGATVDYDEATKAVFASRNDIKLSFFTDGNTIEKEVNGETQTLTSDVPFTMIDGSVFAPVRLCVEAMNAYISWNSNSRQILIIDPQTFHETIKNANPELYQFLTMPIFKIADSQVQHNQEISATLQYKGKSGLDSNYKLSLSELIKIKDKKISADISCDLKIDALVDFYSYISSVFGIDTAKMQDIKCSLLMDKDAIYVKTNVYKLFQKSPLNAERMKDVWVKFDTTDNPIVYTLNDEKISIMDLIDSVIKPTYYKEDKKYINLNRHCTYAKTIEIVANALKNDHTLSFHAVDPQNYSISLNLQNQTINNILLDFKKWHKRFNYSYNQYFYFDYETQAFDFNKMPNLELTEEETNSLIFDNTIDMNLNYTISDAILDHFSMNYNVKNENYGDGLSAELSASANSTGTKAVSDDIMMPPENQTITFQSIQDAFFFPYDAFENELNNIRYSSGYYDYDPQ